MHKWIVIEDIGRDLNPIGYGFKSPVLTPSRFPIDTIASLLSMSGVTKMSEAYEKDFSMRVPLNKSNFRKPFEEIWAELNPGKEFPWANEVQELKGHEPSKVTMDDGSGSTTFTGTVTGSPSVSGTITGSFDANSLAGGTYQYEQPQAGSDGTSVSDGNNEQNKEDGAPEGNVGGSDQGPDGNSAEGNDKSQESADAQEEGSNKESDGSSPDAENEGNDGSEGSGGVDSGNENGSGNNEQSASNKEPNNIKPTQKKHRNK